MKDPLFDRDVIEAVTCMGPIVGANPGCLVRLIRRIAMAESQICDPAFASLLAEVAETCAIEMGGEEEIVPPPETPDYRAHLPYDPWGCRVMLACYLRIGNRHGNLPETIRQAIQAAVQIDRWVA